MSEKSQVLCKYHVSGVCRFGADCAFSHNLADLPNQVCKYYLAGCCAYGSRCRYDHKRPDYFKAKTGGARDQQQRQQQQPPATASPASRAGANGNWHDTLHGRGDGGAAVLRDRCTLAWDAPETHDPGLPGALAGARVELCMANLVQQPHQPSNGAAGAGGSRPAEASTPARDGDGENGNPWGEAQSWEELLEYDEYGDDESEEVDAAGRPQTANTGENSSTTAECQPGPTSGLVMVDDDVGLKEEEAHVVAHNGRRALPGLPGVDGGGGGSGVATLGTCWKSQRHTWERAACGADPPDPADVDLCPQYALHGRCAEGDDCRLVHGLECETCHKYRIHPYDVEEAEEHRTTCRLRHERLEARLRSSGVECGICLEPVLSKPSVSHRRFGLMACDHAFCLSCIRSWRERTHDASLATDTAVRTCPICRTPTHFVTPSLVWPATPEEKDGIIAAYRVKLSSIDCKHFDFGEGRCPFSTSCFYRHMYRDGRLEEPTLRRAGNADGDVRVVMPLRLSAFCETPQAWRLLSRRP